MDSLAASCYFLVASNSNNKVRREAAETAPGGTSGPMPLLRSVKIFNKNTTAAPDFRSRAVIINVEVLPRSKRN